MKLKNILCAAVLSVAVAIVILSARICPGIVIWFAPDLMYFA